MNIDNDSYEAGFRLGLTLTSIYKPPLYHGSGWERPSFQIGWKTAKISLFKRKYGITGDHIRDEDEPVVKVLEDGRSDPVYEVRGEFGFRDETWAESYGPFCTWEQANEALANYLREVLGDHSTQKKAPIGIGAFSE